MASRTAIRKGFQELSKKITELTNMNRLAEKYPNGINKTANKKLLNEVRILQNQLADASIQFFGSFNYENEFKSLYNESAKRLRDMGYKVSNWTGKSYPEIAKIKSDFYDTTGRTKAIQGYTTEQKLKRIDSILSIDKGVQELQSKYQDASGNIPDDKINAYVRQQNKLIESHRPRYTLLKQESASLNKRQQLQVRKRFENGDEAIDNILKRGYQQGWTRKQMMDKINKVTSKVFGDSEVLIPAKNGRTRAMKIEDYNEQWVRYGTTRSGALGTVTAMRKNEFDIVEWVLVGDNHTKTCLELADQKYFSLSGLSKKYPALPVMPPAHMGCKSMIIPGPSSVQEEEDFTYDDEMELRDRPMVGTDYDLTDFDVLDSMLYDMEINQEIIGIWQ